MVYTGACAGHLGLYSYSWDLIESFCPSAQAWWGRERHRSLAGYGGPARPEGSGQAQGSFVARLGCGLVVVVNPGPVATGGETWGI